MALPIQKIRLEFTYEELRLLGIFLDLDSYTDPKQQEILEKLYAKFEASRAKLDPEKYKRE